jgi:hypothetical protein
MGLQLAAQDVCTALSQLCARTIGDVETQLEMQKNSDEDAAKKLADEKMAEEKARLLAEQDEKEKQEKIRKMEQELAEMRGTASAPGADFQPLQYVQQKAGNGDKQDEDEDEEVHSESAAEEPQVCHEYIFILFHAHWNHNYARGLRRKSQRVRWRTLGKGWRKSFIPR